MVPKVNYGVNPFYLKSTVNATVNHFQYDFGEQWIYRVVLPNLQYKTTYCKLGSFIRMKIFPYI